MTTNSKNTRCYHCGVDAAKCQPGQGQHADGCPESPSALPQWMDEWKRGYNYGWEDNHIPYWWRCTGYSRTFILGWLVGKAEIDQAVDDAVQSNYSREW